VLSGHRARQSARESVESPYGSNPLIAVEHKKGV
jgi:hypothetical protein